ncbi:Blue-light-activated histidine kinase [uncultured bacterium]|nr:Blue-light-activated histidine kinase [uncultured bacterium]
MSAVEDMSRDELMEIIRGLKKRVGELEKAEINRRLTIEEHPATIEAFMENIPDAVALISAPEGVVKMISRHALDFFEINKADAQDITLTRFLSGWEILNPDGSAMEKCPTMAALSEGAATRNREVVFRKGSRQKTVLVNSSPVIDGTGKIIGCMTVWREITARKQAEEELKQEKELLNQIIEIMPVGVWIIDNEGRIVEGNLAAKNLWGGVRYVPLEKYCEYKAWWADTGKLVSAEDWAASRAFRYGEVSLNEELEIENFEGKRRTILNSAKPIMKNSRIIGAIAVNQDITERKKYEKALKESERALAEAQRLARVGNWTWEVDADNFSGSEESYNIFEIPPGTPVNKARFMKMIHDEDREMFESAMEDGLRGEVYKFEFRIITAKGNLKYLQSIGELERKDGHGLVMKGIVQDITERKAYENEQKRLMGELQEAFAKIKTLSGLIPICANCKRIRDDKGYWQRIERYIEERSLAEFTHSLCPECEKKLYREEIEGDDEK